MNDEAKSRFVDLGWRSGADLGFANEPLAAVAENQALVFNATIELTLPVEVGILHLKQIGEVCVRLDADIQVYGCRLVIQDPELFVEPTSNCPLAHDRHRRVDIDGSSAGDEKELRRKVIHVVGGQRVRILSVDGQDPA